MRLICINANILCIAMYPGKLIEGEVYNSPGIEKKPALCPVCRVKNEVYRVKEFNMGSFPVEHFMPVQDTEDDNLVEEYSVFEEAVK